MQGLIPCVSPLATCPPLCLIVWKIDMWLCIVLDWVRGWVARMGFLLPALSPDPPDLLGKAATGRPAHQVRYSAEAQQRRQLKLAKPMLSSLRASASVVVA